MIQNNYAYIDPKDMAKISKFEKVEIESITTTNSFDNAFQALDWCYRNPMREVKSKVVGRNTIVFRYNNFVKKFEYKINEYATMVSEFDFSIENLMKFRNIRVRELDK